MRKVQYDSDDEIPAKPNREMIDIEPDAPDDLAEEEEEKGKAGEDIVASEEEIMIVNAPKAPSETPPRLAVIVAANSSVLNLARRQPMVASLQDHFSLNTPSNLVRFRHRLNAARIYDDGRSQTVLEEDYDEKTDTSTIKVKIMRDATSGTTILRISYTVVTAFWTGYVLLDGNLDEKKDRFCFMMCVVFVCASGLSVSLNPPLFLQR